MHCTLFNHRAAQIQFPRATGNYIKDLGRQRRPAQKQQPLGRGEKNNKNNTKKTPKNTKRTPKKTKKTQKENAEKNKTKAKQTQKKHTKLEVFFLIFQFFCFLRLVRGGPIFFLIFFVLFFRIFVVVVFPFCVGVLFSSYFFRVHLPLLRWGPVWTRGPEIECLVFCILARMLCRHV